MSPKGLLKTRVSDCGGDTLTPVRLYLDDERLTPIGWTRVYTAAEAIALLASGGVAEISLDHDLGPPEAGTGYDVACWWAQRAPANP